jgi:general secretion pathway protein E
MKKELINYDISKQFDTHILKETIVLPVYQNELFITCFVCENSNIEEFKKYVKITVKTIVTKQEIILFEIDNLALKRELFILSKQLIVSSSERNTRFFIYQIINLAVSKNASDIHIETMSEVLSVKFRIDGVLIEFFRFDIAIFSLVSSLLKLFANLDITQRRLPQNGRFVVNELNNYDFRISFMPTINGESIVIRILEKDFDRFYLDKIGFSDSSLALIKDKITLTQGLILLTGPTGSGKTTTLYSIIKELKDTNKKIITVEDPVEYKIDNITQISLNREIGLIYSEILKNILRQDPDILLIGEIRDAESLQSAITAAMTGHLVFATLHTNDSVSTIFRLLDLQGEGFLIASVLKCIIAQRLVRKRCECGDNIGCEECHHTGYKSRTIISEVLDIDDNLSSLITSHATLLEMKQQALLSGFIGMYEDGMQKVRQGITTQEEILTALKS